MMNAAALVGLVYFIRGKRDVWVRTEGGWIDASPSP
jgi:hypothetical protein